MRARTGFTLWDLTIALLAVAVLVLAAILVLKSPRDLSPIERARAASCRVNLSNIGKAHAVYACLNNDELLWLTSNNRWDAATGESQLVPPSRRANYNVSSLLFLLVRNDQPPGLFVCPSTPDTPDPNTKSVANWHWDFTPFKASGQEHVSYSYQAPMLDGNRIWRSGASEWSTPVTLISPGGGVMKLEASGSDPRLVIAADRTPSYDGQNATFDWANPGRADPRTGMSQNHRGLKINLLYADLHVGDANSADCGIKNDNIYSAAGTGADGKPLDTNQGPGTLNLSDHRSPNDSFLLGPKRMEK